MSGGNILWGNIPGWNVPGGIFRWGVYLEPKKQTVYSYLIKSLFTNIPQDLVIECIKKAANEADTLMDRTL